MLCNSTSDDSKELSTTQIEDPTLKLFTLDLLKECLNSIALHMPSYQHETAATAFMYHIASNRGMESIFRYVDSLLCSNPKIRTCVVLAFVRIIVCKNWLI